MHDQTEKHSNEHAEGLEQWLLERFDDRLAVLVEGAVGAVEVHHGFGADAAAGAEEDGEEEEDYLREAACVDVGQVGHGYWLLWVIGGR